MQAKKNVKRIVRSVQGIYAAERNLGQALRSGTKQDQELSRNQLLSFQGRN